MSTDQNMLKAMDYIEEKNVQDLRVPAEILER